MNKNWNDRADKDLFFTILSVKNIGVISGSEWTTIGNHMRTLGYGFTNEGCRYVAMGVLLCLLCFCCGLMLLLVRSMPSLSSPLSSPPAIVVAIDATYLAWWFLYLVASVSLASSASSTIFTSCPPLLLFVILDSVFCSASSRSSPSHLVADQLSSLLPTHPPPCLSRNPCTDPGIANTSRACAGLRTSPTLAVPARAREESIRR